MGISPFWKPVPLISDQKQSPRHDEGSADGQEGLHTTVAFSKPYTVVLEGIVAHIMIWPCCVKIFLSLD